MPGLSDLATAGVTGIALALIWLIWQLSKSIEANTIITRETAQYIKLRNGTLDRVLEHLTKTIAASTKRGGK